MWLKARDDTDTKAPREGAALPSARAAETTVQSMVLSVLDHLGEGGIGLNRTGHVTQTNATARHMMGPDLLLAGGKLRIVGSPSADVRLRTLIGQLQQEPSQPATIPWVVVPRAAQQPLLLRPVSLPSLPFDACAILRLTDLEATPGLAETPVAELFGLTPAEVKVAEMLARGKDSLEIATLNKRTVGTVRSQIKAVFAKTGTRRQSELASLMVRLALRTGQMGGTHTNSANKMALQ